jgi:hypothetical protein
MKIGDIVRPNGIGYKGLYRVVWVYRDTLSMLLLTPIDDFQAVPKCCHALLIDCELVDDTEVEPKVFTRYAKAVEKWPEFTRASDEKANWERRYNNDSY